MKKENTPTTLTGAHFDGAQWRALAKNERLSYALPDPWRYTAQDDQGTKDVANELQKRALEGFLQALQDFETLTRLGISEQLAQRLTGLNQQVQQ